MKKYRAEGFAWGSSKIEETEVERESASSIWINGRRENKFTDFRRYFDSWEEAHEFLMKLAEREVAAARRELESANSRLGNVKGMKKP